VRAEVNYKSPARLGDVLTIETTIDTSKNASVTFSHVFRERKSGRVVVEGSATLVATDPDGKVKRLDPEIKKALDVPGKGKR
jgi:acyl-CoA thioester hydrolase